MIKKVSLQLVTYVWMYSQQAHNVDSILIQSKFNVMTLNWHWINVESTLCACWVHSTQSIAFRGLPFSAHRELCANQFEPCHVKVHRKTWCHEQEITWAQITWCKVRPWHEAEQASEHSYVNNVDKNNSSRLTSLYFIEIVDKLEGHTV